MVCQRLMLSHEGRSTTGLNAALPALGAGGVTAARLQREDEGWEIKTRLKEIK